MDPRVNLSQINLATVLDLVVTGTRAESDFNRNGGDDSEDLSLNNNNNES